MDTDRDTRLVASNRKAYHDYFIDETIEAGLVLLGTEVKSLRAGRANLRDSYVEPRAGELYLIGAHISPYEQGNIANHEPLRPRKLLVHKEELGRLLAKVAEKGYTLVPTRLYFSGPHAKIEVALARGKRQYDKRAAIKERESKRDLTRAMRQRIR